MAPVFPRPTARAASRRGTVVLVWLVMAVLLLGHRASAKVSKGELEVTDGRNFVYLTKFCFAGSGGKATIEVTNKNAENGVPSPKIGRQPAFCVPAGGGGLLGWGLTCARGADSLTRRCVRLVVLSISGPSNVFGPRKRLVFGLQQRR
jgi:hypothetical protein